MSSHTVIIGNQFTRDRAKAIIDRAPPGYVMKLQEPKRTLTQNDKMWAMLTDISIAKPEGRKMIPDRWKAVFLQSLGHEVQFEMDLEGRPFPIGHSSSKLNKQQMSELIEFIYEYGARHGVQWSEPDPMEQVAA